MLHKLFSLLVPLSEVIPMKMLLMTCDRRSLFMLKPLGNQFSKATHLY